MRVLIASHSSVVDVYQDKLRYIAATPGVELTLLLPERFTEGSRTVEAFRGHGGYDVIAVPQRAWGNDRLNAFTYKGLRSVFRKVKPDVLHIEEEPESLITVQLVRHALRMKKPPRIIDFTWRNMDMPYTSLSQFDPRRLLYFLTQGMTIPHFDGLIGGSTESEHYLRKQGYEGPVRVIPQYGVAPELYFPHSNKANVREQYGLGNGTESDPFTIGFVGRVMQMKGLDVLVDALHALRDQNAQLVILGSGDYTETLRSRVQHLGLSERVHFIAGVPAAEVAPLLSAMDAVCVPSLTTDTWKEQFGRVIVEAMACGVPIIGSSSGEIPHVVADAGLIAAEGDVQAWTESLQRVMQSAELRATMRSKGIAHVAANYTNEHIAKQIVDFYEYVIQAKASA